jgi:hypothetical protein
MVSSAADRKVENRWSILVIRVEAPAKARKKATQAKIAVIRTVKDLFGIEFTGYFLLN